MTILGVSEAARRLRVHPQTLKRWDATGVLPAIRDSAGRRLYMSEQVDELVQQRAAERSEKAESPAVTEEAKE